MNKLSQMEITQQLALTEGWGQSDDAITRVFTLPSFAASLLFAGAVGHLAEVANHHPDILIQYRKVTLTLSTHEAGGLTEQDFVLAQRINEVARPG